jgi:1,4-alpha-glucan branching enzyme/maltooligosyltrehalose trehalohydrolase
MGEEFGVESPFLFFCDFEKSLAPAVAAGRRNEFARFARFNDPASREGIPDPNAASTFQASKLDWHDLSLPRHQEWLSFYRSLLKLRAEHIVPLLFGSCAMQSSYEVAEERGLTVHWQFPDNSKLTLLANLGAETVTGISLPGGQIIYATEAATNDALKQGTLPPWSVVWALER